MRGQIADGRRRPRRYWEEAADLFVPSGLRRRVEAFKDLLKPEVRARVGVISYELVADVLDRHGEDELASWIRSRSSFA